jgi:hypothetical protein
MAVAYLNILPWHVPGGTEEKQYKLQCESSVFSRDSTWTFLNKSQSFTL